MDAPNYLYFVATFADGSQIFQNVEDKSVFAPGRNCYFDVLQKQLNVPLVCFVLTAEGYPTFGVDLQDGHFEVNGVPFFQHSEPLKEFRLQYFRDVQQHRTFAVGSTKTPVDTAEVGYTLGWESTYKDQTITRFLKIKN